MTAIQKINNEAFTIDRYRWRSTDGEMHDPRKMDTRHLFYTPENDLESFYERQTASLPAL